MQSSFSPLIFLAALGAGGIAVVPFAFLQYVHPHGPGLITWYEAIANPIWSTWVYYALAASMVFFSAAHFVLTAVFVTQLVRFRKTKAYQTLMRDPLKNAAIMAPFISIVMTMNVLIGPVRALVEPMATHLQLFMVPALTVWLAIGALLLPMIFRLLATAFATDFDIRKIHFGWLLIPFALGMFTVTGTGIAALAASAPIAHTAAFVSVMSGTLGLFLLQVKLVALFSSHFAADGMPERQFLPSFLIVIPNLTLYAIAFFRLGHYLEHQFSAELGLYYMLVMGSAFAVETWYLLFGLYLLRDFLRRHYFKQEYYVTLWGLVCPFVAYAVLASFAYSTLFPLNVFILITVISATIAMLIFVDLLRRYLRCRRGDARMECIA